MSRAAAPQQRVRSPEDPGAGWLLRALLALAIATVAGASLSGERGAPTAFLQPFQVRFETLEPRLQTACREARLAIDEVCLMRGDLGRYPSVEELERAGIPPFVPVPLSGGALRYRFIGEASPERGRYLGAPAVDRSGPCLLLLVEEAADRPDPIHRALVRSDAFHLRRTSSCLVHYTLWMREEPRGMEAIPSRPELEGWRQVITGR